MKKLLLAIACSVVALAAAAQSHPVPEFIYCKIIGSHKVLSSKVTVLIDFGQETSLFATNKLRGDDGKPIVFNSMIDAMNWMGADGWELVLAYVEADVSGSSGSTSTTTTTHWVLKKSIESLSPEERDAVLSKFKTAKSQ